MTDEQTNLGLEVMPTDSIDTSKYNGIKTKIGRIFKDVRKTDYDEKGTYVQGLQRDQHVVVMETEKLGETEMGNPINVRENFNLKVNPKTGNLAYSTHPKSNTAKIFAKLDINQFEDAVGKEVLIVEKVSPTNPDRRWLGIQY